MLVARLLWWTICWRPRPSCSPSASRPARPVGGGEGMVKRTYSQEEKDGFAEERRVQLERLQAQIAEKVVELTNGQEWQRWLRVASRFHQYSFGNSLAVFIQRPDATLISGYRMWQTAFNRQVNKGEKGIRILAPITRLVDVTGSGGVPILDADGRPVKALRPIGFKVISVFDVSQTSGEPLPEQPRPVLLTGQAPDGLWDSLQGSSRIAGSGWSAVTAAARTGSPCSLIASCG